MPGKLVEHRCRVKAGTQGMTGGFESHSWAQKKSPTKVVKGSELKNITKL